MIEMKITKENILKILDNLNQNDKEEMKLFYQNYSKKDFIDICFSKKSEIYIVGLDDMTPVALGGIYRTQNSDSKAQLWLLSTDGVKNIKNEFFKYLKSKIIYFQSKFQILYNVIYKSNFKILKFLKKFDFKVFELEDSNFKLFYFNKKGGKIDI